MGLSFIMETNAVSKMHGVLEVQHVQHVRIVLLANIVGQEVPVVFVHLQKRKQLRPRKPQLVRDPACIRPDPAVRAHPSVQHAQRKELAAPGQQIQQGIAGSTIRRSMI